MKITISEELDLNQLSLDDLKAMPVEKLANIIYTMVNSTEPPQVAPVKYNPKGGHNYGHKRKGASSKYHYVSWRGYEKDWSVQFEGIIVGYFDDEIVAALAADKYLDSIEDLNRPRNRTKFTEVLT